MQQACRIAIVALAVLCGGCLAPGKFRPTYYYALASAEGEPSSPNPLPVTASVRQFTAASRYGQRMVRRSSPVELTYDEYHRWGEPPDEMVSGAFCRALQGRGVFRSTSGPDMEVAADVDIEGRVLVFEEEPQKHAVCTLALVLRRARDSKVLWNGTLTGRAPVGGALASDLAKAMSRALDQVVSQCESEWRAIAELQSAAPAP